MKRLNFGRIGLLAGGQSNERPISIKSGKAVYNALTEACLDVVWVDPAADKGRVRRQIRQAKIDCAFIALHGRFGEDGTIQKVLEGLKIPYTGSGVAASRLALDKVASHRIFQKTGINIPRFKVLSRKRKTRCSDLPDSLTYPLVIKPRWEGSSIGLSIIDTASKLPVALKEAYKYGDEVIIEEYIKGKELTVGILEEKPLPVIQIITGPRKFYDYNAKYKSPYTEYLVPAPIPTKPYRAAQGAAAAAHKALGCKDFCRVDMIMADDGKIYVLEVNTIPGLTERSLLPKAAASKGIDFVQLCCKLIELAMKKGN